jgi:3-phenylpropionate/trans-cinnamate dioxygenase ferredoxin subunit
MTKTAESLALTGDLEDSALRALARCSQGAGMTILENGTGVAEFVVVARVDDVPAGKTKAVEVAGKSILLCNSRDQIFAVRNLCSHAHESLECGRMRNGWIACPVHGARFDLETGEPMNPPATLPIETYPVRITDGSIEIEI